MYRPANRSIIRVGIGRLPCPMIFPSFIRDDSIFDVSIFVARDGFSALMISRGRPTFKPAITYIMYTSC